MNRRKRTIGIALLLLLILLVPPFWITYREYRQARLDHALIEAIKSENDQKALEALEQGASGEAKDIGQPPTFKETLLHLWNRFRHLDKVAQARYTSALPLLFQQKFNNVLRERRHSWGPGPNLKVVRSLLDHGALVNNRDEDGDTPLFLASLFSNDEMTRLLLERGANPDWAGVSGITPLMWAQDVKKAGLLVEHGASIEAVDSRRKTALMWAAQSGKVDIVRFLLEHGAKTGVYDVQGKTALDYASDRRKKHPEDLKALRTIVLLRIHDAE